MAQGPRRMPAPQHPSANWGAAEKALGVVFPSYVKGAEHRQQYDLGNRRYAQQYDIGEQQLEAGQLGNEQRRLQVYEQEQDTVLRAAGEFARLLREGDAHGARRFLNSDPFVTRYFQVKPGEGIDFGQMEDGSVAIFRRGANGSPVPQSAVTLDSDALEKLYDRANPQAAGQQLASQQARGQMDLLPLQQQIARIEAELGLQKGQLAQQLMPYLQRQATAEAQTGAITAEGQAARAPLEQATAGVQAATGHRTAVHQAGMQPHVQATEQMQVGQQQAAQQFNTIAAAYQAAKVNPSEGINVLRESGLLDLFDRPVADIQLTDQQIRLLDEQGKPVNYRADGRPAVYDREVMAALEQHGKWKSAGWGMFNEESGQFRIFKGQGGVGGMGGWGTLNDDQMAMLREFNKRVNEHFRGVYDNMMGRYTRDGPEAANAAREAMDLGQELMIVHGMPLNSAIRFSTLAAETAQGNKNATARQVFLRDFAPRLGIMGVSGQSGGEAAPPMDAGTSFIQSVLQPGQATAATAPAGETGGTSGAATAGPTAGTGGPAMGPGPNSPTGPGPAGPPPGHQPAPPAQPRRLTGPAEVRRQWAPVVDTVSKLFSGQMDPGDPGYEQQWQADVGDIMARAEQGVGSMQDGVVIWRDIIKDVASGKYPTMHGPPKNQILHAVAYQLGMPSFSPLAGKAQGGTLPAQSPRRMSPGP